MAQVVRRCDCDAKDCNYTNQATAVHVDNKCIHSSGLAHKIKTSNQKS